MSKPLHELTLKEAVEFAKANGAEPLRQAVVDRTNAVNSKLNALLRFTDSVSFPRKRESIDSGSPPKACGDDKKENIRPLPLAGIPIAVKDNICLHGSETTCASKILKGHTAAYDASVVTKLKNAGADIFAQCNMDEFAFGSSSESSAYGPVRNPWNLECVPGGSSGGSAAAVAADMAYATLGSDTGGSIRQPASFCGVVGLKPTYGRVSRYGLIAFGSSFDQIGPLTKTVEDSAILMNVLAGHDPKDSTSAPNPVPDYTKALKRDVKGLRIGLPKEYFIEGIDPEVEKSVRNAAEVLKKLGAEIKPVTLPHTQYSVAVYYIVAVAEASSNLGRFDGVRFGTRASNNSLRDLYFETRDAGFGQEAKRRILLGTFVLSAGYYEAYYLKGQKVRTLIRQDFENAFKEVDLMLTPTAPTAAFKIGEKSNDPLSMYLSDIFTIPVNLAGVPAISVPCGFTSKDLPVGAQLIGRPFEESRIFQAAYALEQELGVYKRKPGI